MSTFAADRHSSFYDPFAEGNIVTKSDLFRDAFSRPHIDAPPPYVSADPLNVVSAKSVSAPRGEAAGKFPLTYNARTDLVVKGQGTVIANCTGPTRLLFSFKTDDLQKPSLYVEVTENYVTYRYGPTAPEGSTGYVPDGAVTIKGNIMNENCTGNTFLRPEMPISARYWISVDHKNGILRFGRDYVNLTLALYEAKLKDFVPPGVWHWSDPKYSFIDDLTHVSVQQLGGSLKADPLQLVYQPLPVVQKLPPIIKPSEQITLDQLANGSVTVPANLTPECQRLYANVAGANIQLDTPDFPCFSKAIERSVNTEGLLGWQLLEKKKARGGFGKENMTYLRITLGADLGNSPGPPYVLEIWPALHASPIHNHGDSHAVIKVLCGRIKAYYFTSLYQARPIGPPAQLEKDDITWIDPQNYQVHMLSNESREGEVCCTIQCYSYGAGDVRHYESFDYVNEETKEVIPKFEPNSDMRFDEFKLAIRKEWEDRNTIN